MKFPARRKKQPWLNGLIATTVLSLFFLLSSELWASGLQQWAFALAFLAVWVLISVSWSNVDFTEESGSILARIVDHNFRNVHAQVEALEKELRELRRELATRSDRP